MPISNADLTALGRVSLDEFMRNTPVDQIGVEHPLLKKMMSKRKLFLGAKQNVTVQIRKAYDSNFAWAYGEAVVGFNKRDKGEQAAFPWRRAVDGFYISHDDLFSNGIKVREGERGEYKLEQNEKVQLVNLLNENMEQFKLGFMEKLDLELHRDGTASADAVTGLDGLISLTPNAGIVGGLDRATAAYWRNGVATGITKATMKARMEEQWRRCIRNGGSPDFLLAGSAFCDWYADSVTITQNADVGSVKKIDLGTGAGVETGLYFKGVPIIWDPNFETLDALESPAIPWEKRCYFINTKHIDFRDDDMDIVKPTRPHNVLALYQMINLRLALVLKRSNAHSVLAIS